MPCPRSRAAALRDRQAQNNGKHPNPQPQMRNKVELLAPPVRRRAFAPLCSRYPGAVYIGFGMFACAATQGFRMTRWRTPSPTAHATAKPISHSTFLQATAAGQKMHSRTQIPVRSRRGRLSCRIWGWRGSSTHTRRISRCALTQMTIHAATQQSRRDIGFRA